MHFVCWCQSVCVHKKSLTWGWFLLSSLTWCWHLSKQLWSSWIVQFQCSQITPQDEGMGFEVGFEMLFEMICNLQWFFVFPHQDIYERRCLATCEGGIRDKGSIDWMPIHYVHVFIGTPESGESCLMRCQHLSSSASTGMAGKVVYVEIRKSPVHGIWAALVWTGESWRWSHLANVWSIQEDSITASVPVETVRLALLSIEIHSKSLYTYRT